MKNYLYLLFAQNKLFWEIKQIISNQIFKFKVKIVNTQSNFVDKKKNHGYFQLILKSTQNSILLAFIFAVILQLTNEAIRPYLVKIKSYVLEYLPIHFASIDSGHYTSFLLAITAIGGLFIGLHYAGMSTLNGSLYARLPNNIRNLLIQERFGNIYMKFLSFLTFLSFILVAFRIVGFEQIYLMPFFMTIGIGIGVFAFVDLGKRVFSLFDPTMLSPVIFDNLLYEIKHVQIDGLYSNEKSIQKYHNRLAKDHIDTLSTLLVLSKEESYLSGNSLIKTSQSTLKFLIGYQHMKQKIPSNSSWYEEKYSHKDWYKMSDSMVDISYQTGTVPTAEIVYEYFWIEKRISPFIFDAIKVNIENRRFDITHALLNDFSKYLHQMVLMSEVKYAYLQFQTLQSIITSVVIDDRFKDDELEIIGILEVVMNMPVELALVFYQSIDQYSYANISSKLKNINWLDKLDIYNHQFNPYALSQLEWLSEKLLYEYKIEEYIITPHWYKLEMLMLSVSERLIENITYLAEHMNELYEATSRQFDTPSVAYFNATVLNKQWEYSFKFNYQLSKIETLLTGYTTSRMIDDLKWEKFDFIAIQNKLKEIESKLLKEISKSGLLVSFLDRPKDYPDFFGQFLHITGESLIDALCNKDLNLFTEIFPPYFYGSIMKFEQLKPSGAVSDWRTENELKTAVAPIMDLIDISGYAKLFSEYYETDKFWMVVKVIWDKYIENPELKIKPEFFVGAINITESGFGLGNRSGNRIKWKQIVEYELNKLEKREVYGLSGGRMSFASSSTFVNHSSALVRLFAQGRHGSHYDGIDVFIAYYLKNLSIPDDLTYGYRTHRDLLNSIKNEVKNYEEIKKREDDED